METGLFQLIRDLAEAGVLTDTTLILIVIALLGLGYKHVLRPIRDKVELHPTIDEIKSIAQTRNEEEELNVEELRNKLDQMLIKINEIERYTENHGRELKEIQHDVEHIKQILNQFQGHFMYGSRRASDFGNKELR